MKVVATTRQAQGSSASRRLRREDKVPGIVYGGNGQAVSVAIEHNPLYHSLRNEAFHSSILDMQIDGGSEKVLLRDVQWHPYRPQVMHIDFQRVAADQKIHIKVPLHFSNQENSPAVKLSGGIVSHVVAEIEVSCLPGALPAFIDVDLSNIEVGHPLHLNDIALPEGIEAVQAKENPVVVIVTVRGGGTEEEAEPVATPVVAAAPAAKPAKKDEKQNRS